MNFNWTNLISLNNSQNDAFEELLCQLAKKEPIANKKEFIKVGNPDGGVECYVILNNDDEIGFQAKWFLSTPQDTQWNQIEKSFKTALEKHPNMIQYYVAIPLDRADPRIEDRQSFMEKWNAKVEKWKVIYWGSSEFIDRLSKEENVGLKKFFFGEIDLSNKWFKQQNKLAIKDLGARYTPKLNISNDNEYWDFINGNEIYVKEKLRLELEEIFIKFKTTFDLLIMFDNNSYKLLESKVNILIDYFYNNIYKNINSKFDFNKFEQILEDIQEIIIGNGLTQIIGYNNSETPVDKFQDTINEFFDLLRDRTRLYLYNETFVILKGDAGIGKSHLLADIVTQRINKGYDSIFLLGQHFGSEVHPWSQILNDLLRLNCNESEFLGALNSKAEAQNRQIIIFIDAINEGKGRSFWNDSLIGFIGSIKQYEWLGLVISIRSSYFELIVPKEILDNNLAIAITHYGFSGLEYDASKQFFEYYHIIQPSIPLLHPEFSNPLFLKLFCEGLNKKGLTKIPDGYEGITNIIKFFIEGIEAKLVKKYTNIKDLELIDKVMNTLISEMIDKQTISYREAFKLLNKKLMEEIGLVYPEILDDLISEGLLAKNIFYVDGKYIEGIYFVYERFEDHLKAKHLLQQHIEKDKIKESFEQEPLISIFDDKNIWRNRGLIEAISIQLPEMYDVELIDVVKQNDIIIETFLESLLWRKIESITPRIVNIVINKLDNIDMQQNIFETLLVISFSPNHPLNILSFHQKLLDMIMLERDYEWSLKIHNLFVEEKIVKRIINWAWDKKEEFEIEDESLYLYGLTLGWFLTSSNRELRDRATKALVNLFTDRVDVFLDILKQFETVNDLYVLERLYAVSYGIVLRSSNQNGFRELGNYIYRAIFDRDKVIEHILLRDYAKLTIENIDLIINLDIDMNKVLPPYGSSMPNSYPIYKEIEEYSKKSLAFSSILRSMRTEQLMPYGDFGRYIFQSSLTTFDYKKFDGFDIQDLSNYAVKVIHDEYVGDIELFHKAEEMMRDISYERHIHKVERVGKKYQWLAMYKILAKVADNYQVSNGFWENDYIDYKDTSRLYIRNIDPTTILKEKIKTDKICWYVIEGDDYEDTELQDNEAWLKSKKKLPSLKEIINPSLKDEYLVLDSFFTKTGNKNNRQYRYLMYDVHSYIIKQEEFEDITKWAREHNFYQEPIEDCGNNFDEDYLRAYPNSENDECKVSVTSHRIHMQLDIKIPHKMLKSSVTYLNENKSYDFSILDNIKIALPTKWLINKMNLRQSLVDGEWINKNGEVVFFDPTVNICSDISGEGVLVANKKLLLNWLEENGYAIIWILRGEKDLRNSNPEKFEDAPFIGYGGISGYAYFNKGKLIENIDIKIERPLGWEDD